MPAPRIVVDADPAVYRAGFAAQETHHYMVYEGHNGLEEIAHVGDPKDVKKAMAERGYTLLDHETRIVVKPLRNAKLSLNAQLRAIYKKCSAHFDEYGVKGKPYQEIILSGTGNYRFDLSTVQGYKANRLKLVKPVHYAAIREHMVNEWGAFVIDGREADDEVAIRMTQSRHDGQPAILVTIDKDLDQIPGWHYDYKNHVFYDVTFEESMLLFYAQALSGDATDNVAGLRGVGPVKARKWVDEWQAEWLKSDRKVTLEEYLWTGVVEAYMRIPVGLPGAKKYEGPKTSEELALEMARLVWLQRYPGQLWTPPGTPKESLDDVG